MNTFKTCKDCKTPHECRLNSECDIKVQEDFDDLRQSEEHQNMIETVMNNYNEYNV